MEIGFLYAFGAAITWGVAYTVNQKVLGTLSPVAFLFFTSLGTALVMLPFIFSDKTARVFFDSGKVTLTLVAISIILATAANFMIFTSIKDLNATTASIIEIAYPFFVALFSFIAFRSIPNIYFAIGGLLIFAGSVVIIKFG